MKASVLLGPGWEDDSLDVLWRDSGRAFCRLKRKDEAGDIHAFIPIPTGSEHPTLESVNRLTHEHDLRRYLDSSWAMRPLELVLSAGRLCFWSTTPKANPWTASSGSRWRSDSSSVFPRPCPARSGGFTGLD